MHEHLSKPEGYKYISLPRLTAYLSQLKEIQQNDAIKFENKTLWATLNPERADVFKASQLIEAVGYAQTSLLDSAISNHKEQYLSEFQEKLKDVGAAIIPEGRNIILKKEPTNAFTLC